ncbi:MAG: DUF3822 family protein [Bacteroidia bacterium]|jgi:hypothetical protein|nr:DUF3822 family protein [Bacteroidia bacterium]MCC6768378.1 DUF3822 family protein [Bacteroidia bacterium]
MSEIRPLLSFRSPTFSYEKASAYHLRVQLGVNECVLAVFDPLPAAFVLFEKYSIQKGYAGLKMHQAVARIFHAHLAGRTQWKNVEVNVLSEVFTCVPASLAELASPAQHLQLTHQLTEELIYHSARINALEVQLMYGIPSGLMRTIQQYFPDARVNHYMENLLLRTNSLATNGTFVLAHIHGFYLDVIVLKDNKLLFCNTFSFQSPEDFIYFLLLVYDRLALDREQVALHLAGEIESGSAIYSQCFKYFRTLDFCQRQPAYPVPPAGDTEDTLPEHAYFTLLS